MYDGFSVKIQNNGFFSEEINIEKGVHQGGCCSSIYFLVVAEILAMALRGNKYIEGITVRQIRNLLNQFADDTDVFSLATEKSIKAILEELESFRLQSGFTISCEKTTLYRIGSLRHSSAQMYSIDQVAWSNEDIKVLGVTIAHEDLVRKNYEDVVQGVKKALASWQHRGLTLMGRILVVNSLVMSLFVYKMMVLPTIPDTVIKRVETEIRHYLWGGKKAKIALSILKNSKKEGGLNLADLKNKDIALKATWPQILAKEHDYATMVYGLISPILGENIWRVNLDASDVKYLDIKSEFWVDVLKSWCSFNYWHNKRVENQIIWLNSQVRVNGRPILWGDMLENGLIYVHQFYEQGEVKSSYNMREEFCLDVMRYNQIIVSIPNEWKQELQIITRGNFLPSCPSNFDFYLNKLHFSRVVYKYINGDMLLVHNKMLKWSQQTGVMCGIADFAELHNRVYKLTNCVKMRDFQYRFSQRAIITGSTLKTWGIIDSDRCYFCDVEVETVGHLFFYCKVVEGIWKEFQQYYSELYNIEVSITEYAIMACEFVSKKLHIINTIGLFLKQFIYKQKCLKCSLSFKHFLNYIQYVKNIEKFVAMRNDKMKVYRKKWECYKVDNQESIEEYVDRYVVQV